MKLGRTGVKVSNLCLGSDNFGNPFGCDQETSHRIMAKAFESGINFLDTSDSYSIGDSERVIGNYFRASGQRDQVVLATKYRSQVGDGVNDIGGSRYHIVRTVEASLKRLKTDRIDLLYCHSWDNETPIEETLRAVDDLIHQGKVVYAGASNFPSWVLASALWTSDVRNLYRVEAIQSVFNILQPGLAVEMIPLARKHGVAVVPYSPLASGFLTGKHLGSFVSDSKFGVRDDSRGGVLKRRYGDDVRHETVSKLLSVSERYGEPMVRLALQWVADHDGVTAPIFGARRIDQLDGILAAWGRRASDAAMAEVRAIADDFAASEPMNYPPQSGQASVTLMGAA
ncbi:MAG: aldo/keto reductase [Chloroflexi bacterium]|nr:aldo/keto reductase [Chloroflexota bacterium]